MTDTDATTEKKIAKSEAIKSVDFTKFRKIDEETLNLLGQAFSACATIQQACNHANISIETYRNFKKQYPEVGEQLEARTSDLAMAAKFRLKTAIESRETSGDLALKTLERVEKDTFAQRIEQKTDGAGPTVPQINISVAPMFPDSNKKELPEPKIIDVPVEVVENNPDQEKIEENSKNIPDGGVIENSGIKIS